MNDTIDKILKRLEGLERKVEDLKKIVSEKPVQAQEIPSTSIEELAKRTKVSEEKIREIFDLEGDTLTLLKTTGENEKEKTQNTTLLVLLGYKYIFNVEYNPTKEIKRNVAENSIAINNFATHLNEVIPSLIRRKGEARDKLTVYKLTLPGEVKARGLLTELCK